MSSSKSPPASRSSEALKLVKVCGSEEPAVSKLLLGGSACCLKDLDAMLKRPVLKLGALNKVLQQYLHPVPRVRMRVEEVFYAWQSLHSSKKV